MATDLAPRRDWCDGLYFARQRAGEPEWWRGQLAEVGDADVELLLTLVLAWGTPDTLRELKAELAAAVTGLEPPTVGAVVFVGGLCWERRGRRATKTRGIVVWGR